MLEAKFLVLQSMVTQPSPVMESGSDSVGAPHYHLVSEWEQDLVLAVPSNFFVFIILD